MAKKTLDEIVQNLLIDEDKNSEAEYLRYYNIGLRGLKELNMDVQRDIKSIEIMVDSNSSIDFPPDYIGYTKLGQADGDGRVHVLGIDTKRVKDIAFTNSLGTNSTEQDDYYLFRNFLSDGSLGSIYGVGGGNNANGYYYEDRKNNRFLFNGNLKGKTIILEYITDGSTGVSSENIVVDPYAEEALMSFIHWKTIQRKRGINQGEKEAARRDWYNEKRLAIARFSSFNKEEALQASRVNFRQSPKF